MYLRKVSLSPPWCCFAKPHLFLVILYQCDRRRGRLWAQTFSVWHRAWTMECLIWRQNFINLVLLSLFQTLNNIQLVYAVQLLKFPYQDYLQSKPHANTAAGSSSFPKLFLCLQGSFLCGRHHWFQRYWDRWWQLKANSVLLSHCARLEGLMECDPRTILAISTH